jgi:hypothetical protein
MSEAGTPNLWSVALLESEGQRGLTGSPKAAVPARTPKSCALRCWAISNSLEMPEPSMSKHSEQPPTLCLSNTWRRSRFGTAVRITALATPCDRLEPPDLRCSPSGAFRLRFRFQVRAPHRTPESGGFRAHSKIPLRGIRCWMHWGILARWCLQSRFPFLRHSTTPLTTPPPVL